MPELEKSRRRIVLIALLAMLGIVLLVVVIFLIMASNVTGWRCVNNARFSDVSKLSVYRSAPPKAQLIEEFPNKCQVNSPGISGAPAGTKLQYQYKDPFIRVKDFYLQKLISDGWKLNKREDEYLTVKEKAEFQEYLFTKSDKKNRYSYTVSWSKESPGIFWVLIEASALK